MGDTDKTMNWRFPWKFYFFAGAFLLAFHPSSATTLKFSQELILEFPQSATLLGLQHKNQLQTIADAKTQHCLPSPEASVVVAVEAIILRTGDPDARSEAEALAKIIRDTLIEQGIPGYTIFHGATAWDDITSRRSIARDVSYERTAPNSVIIELVCDPKSH
ncbi:hypothetical protein [Azohydromonas australica]|uniref:hypothetical protein n=1 Tax=Azohydromonas australica TaxID=364039 RepID=UPI0012EB9B66|nr:hypothetical protein [Azohydromonas australica]